MALSGKTLFITGASRGIGLAIALRAARDGANIAIAAKTAEPHPKLAGTIYTAAEDIERAGGKALPLVVDVRDETLVRDALDKIGGELHAQYIIGYRPNAERPPGFHSITVTVSRPNVSVRTRPGYYVAAPAN